MKNELAVLIETIRLEERAKIFAEIEQSKPRAAVVIRNYVENRFDELTPSFDRWHAYRVQMAIYTIIRYSLGISNIANLTDEQIPLAKTIADDIFQMVAQ